MTTPYAPQTTADTMARIAAGVDPWIAYRDFLEDWTYLPESRADLRAREPAFADEEQRRSAALLAASVGALCARDGLIAPAGRAVVSSDSPSRGSRTRGPGGSAPGFGSRRRARSLRGTSGAATGSCVEPGPPSIGRAQTASSPSGQAAPARCTPAGRAGSVHAGRPRRLGARRQVAPARCTPAGRAGSVTVSR